MANTVEDKVHQLFGRLIEGNLQPSSPRIESGWEMKLPSGEIVTRSTLQTEAQTIIELGAESIPFLIPFVRNENLAVRYVAIYALEQITEDKSYIPYFSREVANAKIDEVIQTWLEWYKKHKVSE